MATLQKIRNRAGVLVAGIIGLALLAFILGDLLSSGRSIFSGRQLEVAKIDGNSINIMNYNKKIDELTNFYKLTYNISNLDMQTIESIRDEIWRTTIRDIVLGKAYNKLGIQVSNDELKTMLMGDSLNTILVDEPHPVVRRMFTNPETGEFNRAQMVSYFEAISNKAYADEKKRWIFLENQIVEERLSVKYFALVRQGIQPSKLDAKFAAQENSNTVDFSFVFKNFNTIPDDGINVTSAEIENYYNEHKESFKQDDARSIEYVVFELLPSKKDDDYARENVTQSRQSFERSDNPISFVNNNSDKPYLDKNYGKTELSQVISDSIFNAKPGFVTGPFFEGSSYKLVRLLENISISDSVRARHILISLSVQRDDVRAKAIADSLKLLIDKGADFNSLARQFSADDSNKAIGGDLGWFTEGKMVKPFSDACFSAQTGEVKVVKTNYGYHIVKLEATSPKVKKVKVAIMEREVVASDETTQEIYSRVVAFAAGAVNIDSFRNICRKENITPRFATDFSPSEKTLPGLENAREIIRWAYENKKGKISTIFDLSDKYIVACLIGEKKKGYAPVENVKPEIEIVLKKQKKLEKLSLDVKTKIASAANINEVSRLLTNDVTEAAKVRYINPYINGVGLEPVVVIKAFEMPLNQLSAPIIGENGVFVIVVNGVDKPENPDLLSSKSRLKYTFSNRATYEGYEALQEHANIVDNRIKFF
jgi:peptidyl-prolyl cis-trans isomerase D